MDLQGAIFDMDGVLCDSEPFICEAACRMFAERHGVRVEPASFTPFVGMGEDRYLGGVAERHGLAFDAAAAKRHTYACYLELIRGRLQPLPGVHDFVAACRARGWKLAVATSADEVKLDGNLAEIGLPRAAFDACIHGGLVRRKKPDPEIFSLAAARLGLAPGVCLVLEDAPAGLQAARAAGCRALGIRSSFDAATLAAAGAEASVRDLAEACAWLARAAPLSAP